MNEYTMEVTWRNAEELKPYERNAKIHTQTQIANVAKSLQKFGWRQPVVIDSNDVIVIGHCRVLAAQSLGISVPCLSASDLSPEEINGLRLIDNKVNEAEYDQDILIAELDDVALDDFDLDWGVIPDDEEDDNPTTDIETESTEKYEEFTEKFKPKLTTDDCFTPPNIYSAVKRWAFDHYHLDGKVTVRPFYPGGDYKAFEYPENCVVIDNPPFSIISEICRYYEKKKIPFFLFAPHLTLFSVASGSFNYVVVGSSVTYENGARVNTSFVTNLGIYKLETAPDLYRIIKDEDAKNTAPEIELPNYEYPDEVVTSTKLSVLAKYEQAYRISPDETYFLRALDAQRKEDKAIYGAGFLISEKVAAEKVAAEKAAAEKVATTVWKLSDEELNIQRQLGKKEGAEDAG